MSGSAHLLWEGPLAVHYAQAYVFSGDDRVRGGPYPGQLNGLCGATTPGALYLVTGLHTGHVGFRAELHDGPPPMTDDWEEVVEVSLVPSSASVTLASWHGDQYPLALGDGCFRVRYCATDMDAGHDQDTVLDGEPWVDRYALQFWPAREVGADAVLRQTSRQAAYWHREWGGGR